MNNLTRSTTAAHPSWDHHFLRLWEETFFQEGKYLLASLASVR